MKAKLISILCMTLSGDSLITVSLIWLIIKFNGDTRILGGLLFFNTLIPYIIQLINSKKITGVFNPLNKFIRTRMVGFFTSILLAILFFLYNSISILYFSAGIFSIINFFSNQYLEAYFGQMVLFKKIDANIAARIQQTAIQFSALIGASLAGFVIESGGFLAVLLVNVVTYFIGAWFFYSKLDVFHVASMNSDKQDTIINDNFNQKNTNIKHAIFLNFCLLIILAITLYSFNFLLPFLVQKDKGWSAIDFGIIDGLAATGAFISVVVTNKGFLGETLTRSSYVLIGFALMGFLFIQQPLQAGILGILFGFSLNCLRVKIREAIFNSTTSSQLSMQFGRNITFINMMFRALVPLVFGLIITKIPAPKLLFYLGLMCSILLAVAILLFSFLMKINIKNKQFRLGEIK